LFLNEQSFSYFCCINKQPTKLKKENMNLIEKLNWRYATKRMNGTKVPQEKVDRILEAIRLAPTSFGLQAFKVFVISNAELKEKIFDEACQQPQIKEASHLLVFAAIKNIDAKLVEDYIKLIATTREIPVEDLLGFKSAFDGVLAASAEKNFAWTARQAYIAFGVGISAAALEDVDATPMEGFSVEALDKVLGLNDQNLSAVTILTLGYRDQENDRLVKAKKVRKSRELLFDFK
jgi:nitroreductase / dihydropteridine reductase